MGWYVVTAPDRDTPYLAQLSKEDVSAYEADGCVLQKVKTPVHPDFMPEEGE